MLLILFVEFFVIVLLGLVTALAYVLGVMVSVLILVVDFGCWCSVLGVDVDVDCGV